MDKYRPKTLSEVVGQERVVGVLQKNLRAWTHLLFVGPAGSGKTSTAEALCNDIFGPGAMQSNHVLVTNASTDRGIDFVRTRIAEYAAKAPVGDPIQVVFLDEVDSMTQDAQMALRRIMEGYEKITRFILCANHENRLHPAIIDRCQRFWFAPVPLGQAVAFLQTVCAKEGIVFDGIKDVVALSDVYEACGKSMRNALGALQLLAEDRVTPEAVAEMYKDQGMTRTQLQEMLSDCLDGEEGIHEAEKQIIEWIEKGGSEDQIFLGLFNALSSHEGIAQKSKAAAIWRLGDYESYVRQGANLEIEVRSFLWEFAHKANPTKDF